MKIVYQLQRMIYESYITAITTLSVQSDVYNDIFIVCANIYLFTISTYTVLNLQKDNKMEWWKTVIIGDAEINTQKVSTFQNLSIQCLLHRHSFKTYKLYYCDEYMLLSSYQLSKMFIYFDLSTLIYYDRFNLRIANQETLMQKLGRRWKK